MSKFKLVTYNTIAFLVLVLSAHFELLSVNMLFAYGLCLAATCSFTYFRVTEK